MAPTTNDGAALNSFKIIEKGKPKQNNAHVNEF